MISFTKEKVILGQIGATEKLSSILIFILENEDKNLLLT
jgi:hypothetical protein